MKEMYKSPAGNNRFKKMPGEVLHAPLFATYSVHFIATSVL